MSLVTNLKQLTRRRRRLEDEVGKGKRKRENTKKYGTDVAKLAKEAGEGDLRAQYTLSQALELGFGTAKDVAGAKAAETQAAQRLAAWAQQEEGLEGKPRPLILLVEDSRSVRLLMKLLLEKHLNCVVIEAEDGRQARTCLQDEVLPDLIITDIHMPDDGGFGLIDYVFGSQRHKAIPLVVLSSDQNKDTITQAHQRGVKHWLLKSTHPDAMLATIRGLLGMPG